MKETFLHGKISVSPQDINYVDTYCSKKTKDRTILSLWDFNSEEVEQQFAKIQASNFDQSRLRKFILLQPAVSVIDRFHCYATKKIN